MWSLTSSEGISALIKDKYKQTRHNDDQNQPLSVQSWGADGDKRYYYLVEGQDDTTFRVYRGANMHKKTATWWSVAGDIDEVKALSKKLEEVDRSQAARRLAGRMNNAIPRFEGSEEVSDRAVSWTGSDHMLTSPHRSVAVASTAKFVVLPSLGQSLGSRSTKVAHAASACGIPTMTMMASSPTLRRLAAPRDSLRATRRSRAGQPTPPVAARSSSRGPATMVRVC